MDLTLVLTPIKHTSSFLMQLLTWLPDWTRAIVSAVVGARAIHLSSAASPPTELDSLSSSNLDLLDCYKNVAICIGIQIFYSEKIAQQLVEAINGDGGDVSIKDFSDSIGQ
ncbi:hypothetical protein BY996DRAFT_6426191 [Phakopsora pachyrhizi]|nr:hypothetical protein BY996DRAFT_6426191 [Phakopsora pachyrhizi]